MENLKESSLRRKKHKKEKFKRKSFKLNSHSGTNKKHSRDKNQESNGSKRGKRTLISSTIPC
jgi:hypothetical protein